MSKHITQMALDDAQHYTPEQRKAIIDSYPEHEREARTRGVPSLGSGRVFPILEEAILCDPIQIPKHWWDWIACAWPHDGLQHDKGSGNELANQYRHHGLRMLPDPDALRPSQQRMTDYLRAHGLPL